MGAALPIRDDIPTTELRRLARLEDDGRIACRLHRAGQRARGDEPCSGGGTGRHGSPDAP